MSSATNMHIDGSDVVISGLSGRLPESDNIEEFARQLFAGADLVTEDDRRWTPGIYGTPKRSGKLKNVTHFDAAFFGVPAKQAELMDPQLRLLLEVVHETIVDAGLSPIEIRGSRTGVYVGLSHSESLEAWSKDVDKINGYALTGCCSSMFPNRISYSFDLKGPSISIDVACASSMCALVQAVTDIREGRCTSAIVAGSSICLNPTTTLGFYRMTALSPNGRCASFDASACGYVRSDAVMAVLLQCRRDARRMYCTVRGACMNNDGYKEQGPTYPSGDMQCRIVREALEEARLRPQDIVYVEAHGTGTKVGDPEEVNAIAELFCKDRKTPLLLGAVKSNMGHPEPASGLCSITKVLLSMERGVIPGNLHYKKPNTAIPALSDGRIKVLESNTPWQGGAVGVNSFGFGGSNAHVIVSGGGGLRPSPATYLAPRLVLASGRTGEAVERLLQLAVNNPRDTELHALIDAVHKHAIPGHPYRGYTVLDASPVLKVRESVSEPRPVWFVFSGMGSQWAGMARALLNLPVFAASIARSAAALEPYGIDLRHVITEATKTAFDNIINSFVSIAAVQVALVDMLRELNIHPDGFVGHSVGEIGCAYADGALTAEQTVMCAYWRGRCTLEARLAPGAMAAVGLSWDETMRRCPKDIQLACHNSSDNVTVSGPSSSMDTFVKELSADGVFAKRVDTAGIAFHSKYVAGVVPQLRERLREIIPEPKLRSSRWLSTSVPQDQWDSNLARMCDAEYLLNNLLSPVLFADVLALVPARALLVEVAPHALLQAVLKRAKPDAAHVPLVRRYVPDGLVHLLSAVGKAYIYGVQPQVSRLYPAVSWPVSCGTPGLASHIGWDHSTDWAVADFSQTGRSGEHIIEWDLSNPDQAFVAGHNIDGRILFPGTGYLMLVWRTVAKINNLDIEQTAVVFEDVYLRRATIVSHDGPLRFLVTLFSGSGDFEICEAREVVATGTVRLTTDPASERMSAATLNEAEEGQDEDVTLESADIYKELRLRGYNYEGIFLGIKSSDARASRGLLKWEGNWISFMDTALQFSLLAKKTRDLYLPTRLQRAIIDPATHRKAVAAAVNCDGIIPVKYYRNIDAIISGGVEFRGSITSLVPRRTNTQAPPKLEKHVFLPFHNASFGNDDEYSNRHALTVALQLIIENCRGQQLHISELALQQHAETLMLPRVLQVLEAEPGVRVAATLITDVDDITGYAAAMDPLGVRVSSNLDTKCHVVLGVNVIARGGEQLSTLAAASDSFVLLEESARVLDDSEAKALLTKTGHIMVSRTCVGESEYLLLRCEVALPASRVVLEVRDDDYAWVEKLKNAIKRAESEDMRVYVWSRSPTSGMLGLATCLRREPGSDLLRFYYLPGARDTFDPDAPAYSSQVRCDLAINVLREDIWGTYRHLLLNDKVNTMVQVEHAYVDMLAQGDLSSLRWFESDLHPQQKSVLCHVYYASLNFRDIMNATGKLTHRAFKGHLVKKSTYLLGMEFSGCSSTGQRVMGMATQALATTVTTDVGFTWNVPKQWSLEEAATVPVAYATAYYALCVRGRMRHGEAVLVHSGAGGVGQAAIAVALHAGCTVFTTVGTPDKRAFLNKRFPQLPKANIGNSRDCSFEQLVLQRTFGRGVDLVLNSLSGDKLQASLRCIADGGRFLEIGKADLEANTALGMAVLLKNTMVISVLLDALFEEPYDHPEKRELTRCLTEGIAAGVVRPLPTNVFDDNQIEQAFRFMATGKHIGKVLIRVREEEAHGEPTPTRLLSAIPRIYMHPGKSYVLVGGLGGFGLELTNWLAERGARTVVLNSRSGVRTGYQAWCISKWRSSGVRVLVCETDVASVAGARSLLQEAAAAAPVGGIFNLAAVLQDALFENQTPDSFHAVTKPKIDVTRSLDIASRDLAPQLEHFVVFSSVSCGRGNAGQSNYGFANSGMERLCEQRRAAGLPALAVQWGAVGEVGLAAAMFGQDAEVGGTVPQHIAQCLHTLEKLLAQPYAVVSSMVLADKKHAQDKPAQDVVQAVANILGIRDISKVSETATLVELGMDSLMGAEIKQKLERGYDMVLGVQEIRALTFGELRTKTGGATAQRALTTTVPAKNDFESVLCSQFMPDQVLVKLPSQPPANLDNKPVFMVHPIEGFIEMLRGVASCVRGTVYGLQCVLAAPLDNMAALARFYVQRVRTTQPQPPYTLVGYSFGAAVAFEMALQLELEGCTVRLVVIDGSPAFVASHLMFRKMHARTEQSLEVAVLNYFALEILNLDLVKVADDLEQLPNWDARVNRMTDLITVNEGSIDKDAVRTAADSFYRRVKLGNSYSPATRLLAPVMLFRARDNFMSLDEDYGLRSVCAGEVRLRVLAGTHRTILAGDSARAIADDMLAQLLLIKPS